MSTSFDAALRALRASVTSTGAIAEATSWRIPDRLDEPDKSAERSNTGYGREAEPPSFRLRLLS